MFTYKRCSFHTPAALRSSYRQCSLIQSRPALSSVGHRSSALSPASRRCIPVGEAPAARARSPSACTPTAGSLCPCRPPSAGTHEPWHCLHRTARLLSSLSPTGWRFPPPEPPRRGGVGAKFCF